MPTADEHSLLNAPEDGGIERPEAPAHTSRSGAAARELATALGSDAAAWWGRVGDRVRPWRSGIAERIGPWQSGAAERVRVWSAGAAERAQLWRARMAARPRRPWGFHLKSALVTVGAATLGALTTAAALLV